MTRNKIGIGDDGDGKGEGVVDLIQLGYGGGDEESGGGGCTNVVAAKDLLDWCDERRKRIQENFQFAKFEVFAFNRRSQDFKSQQ